MKKIYFLATLAFLTTTVFGQSLKVLDTNNVDISGTTVTVNGTTSDGTVYFYAHVQNTSGQEIQALVCKHVIVEDSLYGNSFCFGPHCYAGDSATFPVNIAAGGIDSSFDASIIISGAGISKICYTFWDKNNVSDTVSFTVKYDITTAINYLNPDGEFLSKPYPVPAKDYISFDYNFNTSNTLEVFDITGKVILQTKLNPTQNHLEIPVNNFKPGIYFYSITVNNKKKITDKFTISY